MKFLRFIDGGDTIYLIARLVYKFEPLEDGAISISTDSPDSSVYEIYFDGSTEDLMARIYANEDFEVIDCIQHQPDPPEEPLFGFDESPPEEWEPQFWKVVSKQFSKDALLLISKKHILSVKGLLTEMKSKWFQEEAGEKVMNELHEFIAKYHWNEK